LNIVITETEYKKGEAVFTSTSNNIQCVPAPAEEDLLADKIISSRAKHAIVGVSDYRGPLYDALPIGGVIARFGVGHDGIDKKLIRSNALYCTNTPDALRHSVAELTIALIMMSARRLDHMTESMRKDQWQPLAGSELFNKTLAIIGCGAIGRRVAQIASFGMILMPHQARRPKRWEIWIVRQLESAIRYWPGAGMATPGNAIMTCLFLTIHCREAGTMPMPGVQINL